MKKVLIDPVIISISLVALSSVLMHASQIDGAIVLAASSVDRELGHHLKSKIAEPIKDTHMDMTSFSGDTFNLRSQPPSARPREDDESDQKNNRHFNDDGLGDLYSMSTT